MVDEQDAVEVVCFMFQGLGQQLVGVYAHHLAVQPQGLGPDFDRTLDHAPVPGQAEAASTTSLSPSRRVISGLTNTSGSSMSGSE